LGADAGNASLQEPSDPAPVVIGSHVKITGNLEATGKVLIEGEVFGEVRAPSVAVDKTGRITGGIVADQVVVSGTVLGSIRGKHVVIESSSSIEGDVFHESVFIEEGASFQGRLHRSKAVTRTPTSYSSNGATDEV